MQIGQARQEQGQQRHRESEGCRPRCLSTPRPTNCMSPMATATTASSCSMPTPASTNGIGALTGINPTTPTSGRYNPDDPPAQQFRNPVHCAELSNDGLLYVCDRPNDRIQVFKPDGTFVKEMIHREEHAGRRLGLGYRFLERSAAEVHLSGRRREREDLHHASATRSRS